MDEVYAEVELVLSEPHNLCTQDELYTARNQCLRCFERADKDGNGCLTFDEIEGLCEYMGTPMRGDECEMLRKMDRDDSGTLERGEWVKYWLGKVSRMPNPEKQQGVVAGHTFSQFDTDGSGSIDAVEFRALVTDLGAAFSDEEVEAALNQLDSDGDGTVDRSEFVAWWVNRSRDSHAGGVVGLKLKRLASKARAMFHTDIHTAAWKGQLDLVKMFVEGDRRMALAADTEEHGDGFMPLHYACYAGHDDMADFLLLAGGPKVVNAKTDSGFTPLFFAAQQGNVALCEKLLAMGADPSIAGRVVASDPETGDVRDTGALLCPVDHAKDTPALRAVFQGRDRCELPEQLDSLGALHVSFSRSGVLMITHPTAKGICRLPVNAWRIKATFGDESVLEFDVPAHTAALKNKVFEHVVRKVDLKEWVRVHRKKVLLNSEADADAETAAAATATAEDKAEDKPGAVGEVDGGGADAKGVGGDGGGDYAEEKDRGGREGSLRTSQLRGARTRGESKEGGDAKRALDDDDDAGAGAGAGADADADARSAVSAASRGSLYSGGGGRRRARRSALDESGAKDKAPEFKWVVTAVEPLLRTVQVSAVNAMGAGPFCQPVTYDWINSSGRGGSGVSVTSSSRR